MIHALTSLACACALALSVFLGLGFTPPEGWTPRPKSSAMRLAEFTLPRAEGDTEDAEVAVFHFPGGAGSVDGNIQRWIGQFDPKEGEPRIERPKPDDKLKVTWVDVAGTYVAETKPGSGVRLNKPGWRMLAAIVEADDGLYFVKAVGPKATIAKNADAIRKYVGSAKPE
jgi:hypothetical protein